MAFAKWTSYSDELNLISASSKILSHPERLQILMILKHEGPKTVNEIARLSPLSRPTISQHLKILRDINFVDWREHHPNNFYSINQEISEKCLKSIVSFYDLLFCQ